MHKKSPLLALIAFCIAGLWSSAASAFCGFYVSGADAKLYNNATLVVLMRDGTRTVLSMQNNYQGPAKDFALVVPVPTVLQKTNVRTLPAEVFERVDKLAAPRLVEYWEQDPCAPQMEYATAAPRGMRRMSRRRKSKKSSGDFGVKIEAQFRVGEYEIVILSAKDSTGLDTWLKLNKYNIPAGAEPVLKPYVQKGMKFFVAKVDVKKVRFDDGKVVLSPLRFHYDSKDFSLPVRLGLLNSSGTQDLLVHILAKNTRYQTANYENVTIPTNLDVAESAIGQFGGFYTALFDQVLRKHKRSVVTEYAWDASSCDPCPSPPLTQSELATLGADVIDGKTKNVIATSPSGGARPSLKRRRWRPRSGFVLTRLHARYTKDDLGEDLVFRKAKAIAGGREFRRGKDLEQGAQDAPVNNFQARYAIRHPWKGEIKCDNPRRGIWGGPPGGAKPTPRAAAGIGFKRPKPVKLAAFLKRDLSSLDVVATPAQTPTKPLTTAESTPPQTPTSPQPPKPTAKRGCGACSVGSAGSGRFGFGSALALLGIGWGRRRRRSGCGD